MTQFPAAALGTSELVSSHGLRDGGSPWLLHLRDPDGNQRTAVLRVDTPEWRHAMRTEAAAIAVAREAGLPAPALLDADLETDELWVLCTTVPGSSTIPVEASPARMRALGMLAARIQAVTVAPTEALPRRDRPIGLADFAGMRQRDGGTPLLSAAAAALAASPDGQGRPDLSAELMVTRRDAFISDALERLSGR